MDYSVDSARVALRPAAQQVTEATMTAFGSRPTQPAWPGFPWQLAQFGDDAFKALAKPKVTNALSHALDYWHSITPEIAEGVWSDIKTRAETLIFGKPRSEITGVDWITMSPELATLDRELARLELGGAEEGTASHDPTLNGVYHERLAIGRYVATVPRYDIKDEATATHIEMRDFDALIWNAAKDQVGETRYNFTDALALVAAREGITSTVLGDEAHRLGNSVKWMTELGVTQLGAKSTIFELAN